MENESRELVIKDPAIVSVFRILGYTVEIFLENPSTCAWRVKGDDILGVLQGIYSDTIELPIGSFIKTYKDVRSTITLTKQLGGKRK